MGCGGWSITVVKKPANPKTATILFSVAPPRDPLSALRDSSPSPTCVRCPTDRASPSIPSIGRQGSCRTWASACGGRQDRCGRPLTTPLSIRLSTPRFKRGALAERPDHCVPPGDPAPTHQPACLGVFLHELNLECSGGWGALRMSWCNLTWSVRGMALCSQGPDHRRLCPRGHRQ